MTAVAFYLAIFLAAVAVNALVAGYQTGFLVVDRIRVQLLADEEKNVRAGRLLKRIGQPDWLRTTILITTAVTLITGVMALAKIMPAAIAALVAAPIFLVFSEIIPRSIFRRHPETLSLALAPVLRLFEVVLAPLIWPAVLWTHALRYVTRTKAEDTDPVLTSEEEFRLLVDESAAAGGIEREEQELIHNVMDLQRTPAKEIMVPRTETKAICDAATREELINLMVESGLTRIPVYHESIDHIIGVVNTYDVLLDTDPDNPDITRLVREISHVHDTMHAADVLQFLKESRQHIAIVTDEYGGTDGVITLEDVLEEIFGEIHDEHDRAMDRIRKIAPHGYVVDARMSLYDLSKVIGIEIIDDSVETVGGWVTRVAGRIPDQGEKIKHNGFRITVLEGEQNQVAKIRLDVLPEARGESPPQANPPGTS